MDNQYAVRSAAILWRVTSYSTSRAQYTIKKTDASLRPPELSPIWEYVAELSTCAKTFFGDDFDIGSAVAWAQNLHSWTSPCRKPPSLCRIIYGRLARPTLVPLWFDCSARQLTLLYLALICSQYSVISKAKHLSVLSSWRKTFFPFSFVNILVSFSHVSPLWQRLVQQTCTLEYTSYRVK